ncbi:DUF5057 domain-containing protein [Isobaculum melis]|uniref:DUF5057 domain-containing protein n=1 Tax=Isobaculum melis TaxID=142588 RepID=A0A1H9S650_9LACT|nr:hypothetical protein [Isobaculum melis]SER79639.1 hypothetical protein SAMN04488559_10682 [Isobaculum melis]
MKKKVAITLFVLAVVGVSLLVFNPFKQERIKVKGADYETEVVKRGDFRLTAENKWDLENERIYVSLEWDEVDELLHSGYQVYQSDDLGSTWNIRSMNFDKAVKVLNIYPDVGGSNTLKRWMDDASIGLGLVDVTPMSLSAYNANPQTALMDQEGNYKYDVLVFGSWDNNNGKDLNEAGRIETKKFMDVGRGVLFGHDTVWAGNPNFNSFKDYLGITTFSLGNHNNPWGKELRMGSTQVRVVNNGYLMKYPHELANSVTLNIPYAHSAAQMTRAVDNTRWLEFLPPFGIADPNYRNGTLINDATYGTNNHYLITKENIGLIQTGHSNGASTKDEMRILVNTIYNLAQVSLVTYGNDQTVIDDVAPEPPSLEWGDAAAGHSYEDFPISIKGKDKGKPYQWYVLAETYERTLTSDVVMNNVKSNIAGYFYVVDDQQTSNLKQVVEGQKDEYGRISKEKYDFYVAPENSTALEYETKAVIPHFNGATDANKFVHVVAVDRANNISEVSTKQVREIMIEFRVTETYSDDFGNKLKENQQVAVKQNGEYIETFPSITDYLKYSYQIDNGVVETANEDTIVEIMNITNNHTVNYVYTRPVKLHLRQVILERNGAIAIPDNGHISVWNTQDQTTDQIASKMKYDINSGTEDVSFSDIEFKKTMGYHFLHLKPNEPSLYEYVGSVVTNSDTPHNVADRTAEPPVLSLAEGTEYWATIYLKPVIDMGVYLNVVNDQLNVYYSNINKFTVFIDGKKYRDYSVDFKPTVESIALDMPISEIRNKVSVKFLTPYGVHVTVYWNNTWDFVNDRDR